MNAELARKVDEAIDSCIRTGSLSDPTSFERCDGELAELEGQLLSHPEARALLQRVRAHRVLLFSETGRHEQVLRQSDLFLRDAEHFDSLDLSNVALLRIRSLHALGSHDAEVDEALSFSDMPSIHGSSLLALLEFVMKRHPGVMRPGPTLYQKVNQSVDGLRSSGYRNLPEMPVDADAFEQWLISAANQYRKASQERAAAIFAETQE